VTDKSCKPVTNREGETMDGPTSRRGQVAIAASAVGFGVSTALSVVALHGLRPADLLAIELAGSAAVLLAVAAGTGRLHRRGAPRALAQGAVLPGLCFLLGDLGLARTTATSGALLLSVDTVATVILAALFLRERIGTVTAAALALGTAGTVLVALNAPDAGSTPTTGSAMAGNLLVLASVLGGAGYVVWSRRTAQPTQAGPEDSIGRTAWQFVGAILAVSPFVLGSWWTGGSRVATAEPHQLVAAAAVLLCGLGALLAFNIGIGAVSASRAGLLFTLQPLAGAVTAVGVLGESLVTGQAIGGALILACLILLTRDGSEGRSEGSDPTPAAPAATTRK
jgi:drug/metabolite transporter (DMT)-like permease